MSNPDQASARQALHDKYESAQRTRLEGNEHFKAGETKKALMSYHLVLTTLKGLDQVVNNAYPLPTRGPDEAPDLDNKTDANGEETMQWKIKNTIVLTYCNMAACHTKTPNWKRCLDCAQSALKIDPDNRKALYREAQAKIGFGELQAGKTQLLELQKQGPDAAVSSLLKQLELDDKEREKKANKSMHGFLKSKAPESTAKTPAITENPT